MSSSSSSVSRTKEEWIKQELFNWHESLYSELQGKINLHPTMYNVSNGVMVHSNGNSHVHSHAAPSWNMENIIQETCNLFEEKLRTIVDELWGNKRVNDYIRGLWTENKELREEVKDLRSKNEFLKEEDMEV